MPIIKVDAPYSDFMRQKAIFQVIHDNDLNF